MKLYIVSIPWDSYRVSGSYVFTKKEEAETFVKEKNELGYNGYTGGLVVETVLIEVK